MDHVPSDGLWFTLLNDIGVRRGEQSLPLGQPKLRAVLCALAFRRRQWVSSSALLDALYADGAPASGVAVVQTYISMLRRALAPALAPDAPSSVLLSGPNGYQLRVTEDEIDLGVFDRLVTDAARARERADWDSAGRLYARALELSQGELLAGVPGPYAEVQRSALVERRLAVVEDSLDVAVSAGRAGSVVDDLRVMIAEHPLRERPPALLMRALYDRGRQSEALEVYARTRRLLVDELGVEPGAELRLVHERILDGKPLRATAAPVPDRTTQLVLDRDHELAGIESLIRRASAGSGGIAVVSGPPGYGKSLLLGEIARRTPTARWMSLAAREHSDSALASGLAEILGLSMDEVSADPERLVRALATAERPLVLLADDATDTDEPSMRLLKALAPRLRTMGVLMVVAVREFPFDPVAAQWHIELETAAVATFRLSGLSEAAIAKLVTREIGACTDLAARQIHEATGSTPLFVTALVQDFATLHDRRQVPHTLPGGCFTRAVQRVLSQHPPQLGQILCTLAVLHDHAPTLEVLAAACGIPLSGLRDRCELLVAAGVLASTEPPAFRHPLPVNTLRRLLTPQETAQAHVAAARRAQLSGQPARQVARYLHGLTGTQWTQWTETLVDAADESMRDDDIAQAGRYLEAALNIATCAEREEVLLRLGQVTLSTNPAVAALHLEEALSAQRARKVIPTAVVPLAWTMASQGRADAADALLDTVITECEAYDPRGARALRASCWTIAALNPRSRCALTDRLRATAPANGEADDPIAAAVLIADDAAHVRGTAREMLDRFPIPAGSADGPPPQLLGLMANIAMWCDDLALVNQLCAQSNGHYFGAVDVYRLMLKTEITLRRGRFHDAVAECRLVSSVPPEQRTRRPLTMVGLYARALLGLGRIAEAEQWLNTVDTHVNAKSWEWGVVLYVRGQISAARGDAHEAAAHFLEAGRRADEWGLINPGHQPWRTSAAVELAKAGQHDRARALATEALGLAQRWDVPRYLGLAWHAIAMTAELSERITLLDKAVGYLRRAESVSDLMTVLLDLARARAEAGDTRAAHEILFEVRSIAEPLGAALVLGRVDTQLRALLQETQT